MAVKPAIVPAIWAPGPLYTTGPFVGLSNKVAVAGAVAVDGHRPGAADPTPAEYVNDQQNKITTWIFDWLSQGSTTASPDTHIMETDVDGRTEVVGLDIADPVDRTVGTWIAANTVVPAVILRTAGNGFQIEHSGAGTGALAFDMTSGSGFCITALDTVADAATLFSVLLQGNGGIGSIRATGGSSSGLALELTSSAQPTMTLTNGGTGVPLRMAPQVPPGVPTAGDIWPDTLNDDLEFVASSGTQQRVWSSEKGYVYAYASTNVSSVANGTQASSFNFGFEGGKTYVIRYGFDFGRTAGSTRDVWDFVNIGGFGFPDWYGVTLELFQGGAFQREKSRSCEFEFVAPFTGVFLVDLNITETGGAGAARVESSWISVTGAID